MPTVSHSGFLKFLRRFHKKSTHRNLLRTLMYKTQKDLQQRSHHAPPRTRDNQRLSPSKLCISVYDFTKLTIPWSSTALDRQSPKISGPNVKPRASTRLRRHRRSKPLVHALPRASKLSSASVDARDREMTSWMTSSSITRSDPSFQMTRFDPDRPANLTQFEPPAKKEKKKRKEKEKML